MRVALVHDWLMGMGGGERALEELIHLFPGAEIFTLLHARGAVSRRIEAQPIHASFLDRLPAVHRHYRAWLPLFPSAIERLRICGFDLVISNSHCVAKGAPAGATPHLCYCHTPMRYAWDGPDAYLRTGPVPWRRAGRLAAAPLRRWDAATTDRVDAFVANSLHVRERIRRAYGRHAAVVYPPVDVARFRAPREPGDSYLVLGALVPHKRVELAVQACSLLRRRLVVAGDGPEAGRLRRMAGPTVTFLGRVSDERAAALYSRCRALLFPGVEDFGITPVEAHAAGAPVIAFASGGALETVRGPIIEPDGQTAAVHGDARAPATGVFFRWQNVAGLTAAILHFERARFDETASRRDAQRFAPEHFGVGIRREVGRLLDANASSSAGRAAPARNAGTPVIAAGA